MKKNYYQSETQVESLNDTNNDFMLESVNNTIQPFTHNVKSIYNAFIQFFIDMNPAFNFFIISLFIFFGFLFVKTFYKIDSKKKYLANAVLTSFLNALLLIYLINYNVSFLNVKYFTIYEFDITTFHVLIFNYIVILMVYSELLFLKNKLRIFNFSALIIIMIYLLYIYVFFGSINTYENNNIIHILFSILTVFLIPTLYIYSGLLYINKQYNINDSEEYKDFESYIRLMLMMNLIKRKNEKNFKSSIADTKEKSLDDESVSNEVNIKKTKADELKTERDTEMKFDNQQEKDDYREDLVDYEKDILDPNIPNNNVDNMLDEDNIKESNDPLLPSYTSE